VSIGVYKIIEEIWLFYTPDLGGVGVYRGLIQIHYYGKVVYII